MRWSFATSGEPLVVDDATVADGTLTATVPPELYGRVRDEQVFGPTRAATGELEPIVDDRPVRLRWTWVGDGPAPGTDDASSAADWRLLDVTQDHGDGVHVGYSLQRPDRIADAVLAVLLADGWEAVSVDGGPLRASHPERDPVLECTVWIDPAREIVVFLADLGLEPGAVDRARLAEWAADATHGMDVGAVDLTPEGRVRVRQGLDVEDVEVTGALVRGALYAAVAQAEQLVPALRAVLAGAVG